MIASKFENLSKQKCVRRTNRIMLECPIYRGQMLKIERQKKANNFQTSKLSNTGGYRLEISPILSASFGVFIPLGIE